MIEKKAMLRKMAIYVGIFTLGFSMMLMSSNRGIIEIGSAFAIGGIGGYFITPMIYAYKDPDYEL